MHIEIDGQHYSDPLSAVKAIIDEVIAPKPKYRPPMVHLSGARMKLVRERRGKSIEVVAVQLAISPDELIAWETDKALPDPKQLAALQRIYSCLVSELLNQDELRKRVSFLKDGKLPTY